MKRTAKRRKRPRKKRPRYRRRGRVGGGLLTAILTGAEIGEQLGRSEDYRRMGAKGATGHYNRRPTPWIR